MSAKRKHPSDDASSSKTRPETLLHIPNSAHKISHFPLAHKQPIINRPHPSVLALVAAERSNSVGGGVGFGNRSCDVPNLENISHGQLQTVSSVARPGKFPEAVDGDGIYRPLIMEGRGVVKAVAKDRRLVVPVHADWFSMTSVHRLERQLVPQFFSGKTKYHTPERYAAIRNRIIDKYLENPGKRLLLSECQGLVQKDEIYDLSRIVRFLDHWGIINYLVTSSMLQGLRLAGSLLREDAGGELQLQTSPLKSVGSLILFDRPTCSLSVDDVAHLSSASSFARVESDGLLDLDCKIRERLAEYFCTYCSQALPHLHYQSQKEADVILCLDCFHGAKFITGHSSLDFVRVDSNKDIPVFDVDSWTDEETLLLLEAVEKYSNNWNDIAEHVGTKSKVQCIMHFVRLPVEDDLLENIEIPCTSTLNGSNGLNVGYHNSNSNVDASVVDRQDFNSGNQLPFANAANPLMSLVAFLTSSIGPRVAASCANAALSVLTNEDPIASGMSSEIATIEVGLQGSASLGYQADGTTESQTTCRKRDSFSLTPEFMNYATKRGLSAAAMKAKLFADQEECEIQRLVASITNYQFKRLELKLKQFAEIENLLVKESDQVERTRQRLSAERVQMMSSLFGQANTASVSRGTSAVSAAASNMNIRPSATSTSVMQPNMPAAYTNNAAGHQQMPCMQRSQMFPFGPCLPVSAIHPPPSGQNTHREGMPKNFRRYTNTTEN